MSWVINSKIFMKLGVAALALGALATSGNAQNAYKGKFTLTVETYWGGTTLPAGDYTFTLPFKNAPYTFYIQGHKFTAIISAVTADDGVVSGRAQLNLVNIAKVHTIQTFEAPELGLTFLYWTPTKKYLERKEVWQKSVPQTAPASQVSENKTSIEVHTSGR
jgi:hypothetical protein